MLTPTDRVTRIVIDCKNGHNRLYSDNMLWQSYKELLEYRSMYFFCPDEITWAIAVIASQFEENNIRRIV